jgi:Fur family ferric uptake transcriptional regulator
MKDTTKEKDVFEKYLKGRSLKFTPERRAILEEVFSLHTHFDVETLFAKLHQKKANVSRATIYRMIPLLLDSGLVREAVRCKDMVVYEHVYGHRHHDHMVCIKCGKIIEFRNERIEELQNEVCRKHKFKPVEHRLGIRGYCKDCQ